MWVACLGVKGCCCAFQAFWLNLSSHSARCDLAGTGLLLAPGTSLTFGVAAFKCRCHNVP